MLMSFLTEEETEAQRLSNLPNVTGLVNGRDKTANSGSLVVCVPNCYVTILQILKSYYQRISYR